jgi:hypothetical protein
MDPLVLFQWACMWACPACEVAGRSVDAEPRCWNCGGPVRVTAQGRWAVRPERSAGPLP